MPGRGCNPWAQYHGVFRKYPTRYFLLACRVRVRAALTWPGHTPAHYCTTAVHKQEKTPRLPSGTGARTATSDRRGTCSSSMLRAERRHSAASSERRVPYGEARLAGQNSLSTAFRAFPGLVSIWRSLCDGGGREKGGRQRQSNRRDAFLGTAGAGRLSDLLPLLGARPITLTVSCKL